MKKKILLGITGSIAAYKAADIANELTKDGYDVTCVMTKGGMQFITPLTLQTLTKNRVYTDVFEAADPSVVEHIYLAQSADLILIAPASADIMAKAAAGIADDLLSTLLLAVGDRPVYFAPAMNTTMYESPANRRNMETLKGYGYRFIEPRVAGLACGTVGNGALAKTDQIVETVKNALEE